MGSKLLVAGLLFFLTALTPLFSQPCDCVNTGNCPVPITDNGTFNGMLDVTVNGANDLGQSPLTSVCFTITHTWIGDLNVSLTSPSGVNYMLMADANNNYGGCGMQEDNIDICIVAGSNNPLTNNTEYQCNSGPCPAGTCCLTGNWTVACGGVVDPITNALEAPNCDLDDFNVAGHPANGTWTLTVNDVCNMDTGTLDNFSLNFANGTESCISCVADGGNIDSIDVLSCYGNPNLLLNLPPNYTGSPPDGNSYGYAYIISQNGTILEINTVADLTSQPAGTYQVHGLSYYLADSTDLSTLVGLDTSIANSQLNSTTAPFCGDMSINAITVTIEPEVPVTTLDTVVCEGDCITVGAQQICADSMVILSSWLGCDSVIDVTLTTIYPDTVSQTMTVCAGDCVDINGQTYCAPGPYMITLPNWQGCDSVINLAINEITVNAVIDPASPPAITCTNNSVALDGSMSTSGDYAWSGPNGFSSTQTSITATDPGVYTFTVTDNTISPACTATTSVTVADGVVQPDLVVVGAAPGICAGESIDLTSLNIQDQNNTNPTITFHSDTPATPANELNTSVVMPAATTTYYILGTTGSCSDETSIIVSVVDPPTSDFSATANICQTDAATITYSGNAGSSAAYYWNFNGGSTSPGTGAGPHDVTWIGSGSFNVTLTVEENGCTSTVSTQTVTVEAPLQDPIISCDVTTSTIEFSWSNVQGATGYNVTLLSGTAGVQNGNTYLVTGLNPGDEVTIEVEAIGAGICGNSSAQQSCIAQDCPTDVVIDISPVADICLSAAAVPFDLTATVTGGSGNGTLTWSGNGITDAANGTFDPQLASIGSNVITATYQEDNCQFTETISINVYQTPVADFIVQTPVCENEASVIVFNGNTENGSTYNWDFDGGNITSGSGEGPYYVSWPADGTYTVTLWVESPNACISSTATGDITVENPLDQPVISCSASTSAVVFSWNDVPGATDYNVTLSHTATQLSNTSYEVTGLVPGEQVDITVEAEGSGPCGNSTSQSSCTAQECPTVTLAIDPVADLCRDETTSAFMLTATVTGDSPDGTLVWSGDGITDPDAGIFDPQLASEGANSITLTYSESTCVYTDEITINVYQTPEASFSATAPVCVGEPSMIYYTLTNQPGQILTWDFDGGTAVPGTGVGPHDVTWSTAGNYTVSLTVESAEGCISETTSTVIPVEEAPTAPAIDCQATTTSVEFSWTAEPGLNYSVNVLTGQAPSTESPGYILFSGITPGEQVDIEVTAAGSGACEDAIVASSCNALPCPDITVEADEVDDFCMGTASPVQLNATVTNSNGSGTGSWSGNGVSNGTFDPAAAGFGVHVIFYTFEEEACIFQDSIAIGVYQQPDSDFTTQSQICISDAATVSYSGTAGNNASFVWDFDGGNASPGTGPGPHEVTWDTPGDKTITLTVNDNGCSSNEFTQQVQVDDVLVAPTIVCNATTESITFIWNDVDGAANYAVDVLSGQTGTQSDTTYSITGLAPGEEVQIQVTVSGNTICPASVSTATCFADDCQDINVAITPEAPICLTDGTEQVTLQVDIDGGADNGTGTWDGPGIIDPVNGIFDPAQAGIGIHAITYTYQLVNCYYTDQIEVEIVPPPVADAGEDFELTCWETETSVRLGGDDTSIGPNITYQWSVDSGVFPDNANSMNPVVAEPGIYTLTVSDVALGCASSDIVEITSTQTVPTPEISVNQMGCSDSDNGLVSIDNITGGMEPYLFSLNGAPYIDADTFPFLAAGDYSLTVIDGAGCESEVTFTIEPASTLEVDLTANLVGRNYIEYGESIQLYGITTTPVENIDSVIWSHPDILDCTNCLDPMASPEVTTALTITVYANGCEESATLIIYVEDKKPVYVPNAFSPNNDGVNDLFMIYGGPQVEQVRTLMVFDRWGETVCKKENFQPEDPVGGWDGKFNGRPMDSGVFVWYAEVEFTDGTIKLFEGDVTLMR